MGDVPQGLFASISFTPQAFRLEGGGPFSSFWRAGVYLDTPEPLSPRLGDPVWSYAALASISPKAWNRASVCDEASTRSQPGRHYPVAMTQWDPV